MLQRITTGQFQLNANLRARYLTTPISGTIEKVIIKVKKGSSEMNITMKNSDGEQFLAVMESGEHAIYYPRNLNVAGQKYTGASMAQEGDSTLNADRWICLGPIEILVEGQNKEDAIDDIRIMFDGEFLVEESSGEDAEVRSAIDKGEGIIEEFTEPYFTGFPNETVKIMEELPEPFRLYISGNVENLQSVPYYDGLKEIAYYVNEENGLFVCTDMLANGRFIAQLYKADESGEQFTVAPDKVIKIRFEEFDTLKEAQYRARVWMHKYKKIPHEDLPNPEDIEKDGGAVSSTTGGVSNPRHDSRRRSEAIPQFPMKAYDAGEPEKIWKRRDRDIEKYMMQTLKEIMKRENVDMPIGKADAEQTQQMRAMRYSDKFQGISIANSNKIKDYVIRAINAGYGPDRITKYIKRVAKVDTVQAERIMRTETQAMQNTSREWAYKKLDPDGEWKYKWIGPSDNRTTKTCQHIGQRTKEGVSMDELRKVIEEESAKAKDRGELPPDYEPREWTPHFQCRHTFVRSR